MLKTTDTISLSVKLSNTGKWDGDEVIEVYVIQSQEIKDQLIKVLVAFERIHLLKGESKEVGISIPVQLLRHFNPEINACSVAHGSYELCIGAASDDIRLKTYVTIN
jgi:beta-glucosidase